MALRLLEHEPDQQIRFSLKSYIEKVRRDLAGEGRSPLDYFNLDNRRVYVPGVWRPSSLRRCMRRQVYKATKCPKSNAVYNPRQQWDFDRGHVFGAWLAAYVEALQGRYGFEGVQCEKVVHCSKTRIGGKLDICFVRGGYKYVVEVKSKINPSKLSNIRPQPTDVSQLNDYMKMEGADAGFLVYFGVGKEAGRGGKASARHTMLIKDFFFLPDDKLWEDSRAKTQVLSWFLRDQTKLAPKTTNTFLECSNCEWRGTCESEVTPQKALQSIQPPRRQE